MKIHIKSGKFIGSNSNTFGKLKKEWSFRNSSVDIFGRSPWEREVPWEIKFKIDGRNKSKTYTVNTVDETIPVIFEGGSGILEDLNYNENEEKVFIISPQEKIIFEMICVRVVKKLGMLSFDKECALTQSMFQKAVGNKNKKVKKNIKEFMNLFSPILNKINVVKKIDVLTNDFLVFNNTDEAEKFKKFIWKYFSEELLFIYVNLEEKFDMTEVRALSEQYNPDLDIDEIIII
ncbi:hypothetical protein NRK67_16815 (plasmid) [Fusobacteria bacterium ZRK30]|nr:hypothetical protein NRK67_16815 [Fusobacteria bacterium ZRK30]